MEAAQAFMYLVVMNDIYSRTEKKYWKFGHKYPETHKNWLTESVTAVLRVVLSDIFLKQ